MEEVHGQVRRGGTTGKTERTDGQPGIPEQCRSQERTAARAQRLDSEGNANEQKYQNLSCPVTQLLEYLNEFMDEENSHSLLAYVILYLHCTVRIHAHFLDDPLNRSLRGELNCSTIFTSPNLSLLLSVKHLVLGSVLFFDL